MLGDTNNNHYDNSRQRHACFVITAVMILALGRSVVLGNYVTNLEMFCSKISTSDAHDNEGTSVYVPVGDTVYFCARCNHGANDDHLDLDWDWDFGCGHDDDDSSGCGCEPDEDLDEHTSHTYGATEAGAYEDSGKMYHEEMVMKRMRMKKLSAKRFMYYLYDLICGYGEKPKNVVISAGLMIVFFTLIYLFPSGLAYSGTLDISDSFLAKLFHSLYFSTLTFATLGHSGFEPKGYMRPFVMAEALLGIFMMVLFVLVFGRKMMRR